MDDSSTSPAPTPNASLEGLRFELVYDETTGGQVLNAFLPKQEWEVGHLVVRPDGVLAGVHVEDGYRRRGIATALKAEYERTVGPVSFDWDDMDTMGALWAGSFG